jgi:general secretion pathway protein A
MNHQPILQTAIPPLATFQPDEAPAHTDADPLADLIHPFPQQPPPSTSPAPRPLSFETDLMRFYGFRENPFADCIHPAFFYRTESHAEAFRNMMLAADFAASLGLVTAPSGTGKTLLTQLLLQHLAAPQYLAVLVLVTPGISKTGLLREILSELNVALPVGNLRVQDLVKLLSNHIIDLHERGQRLVIMIDEAHLLSGDCLHIVRTISNIEVPTRKLVTCLLFAESRLDQRLTHPSYESLRNRIYLRSTLTPLSPEDVAQFVKFRLIVAGRMTELFTPAALAALHKFSGGIPRTLNKLALLTLVEGAATQRETIDADLVVAQGTRL